MIRIKKIKFIFIFFCFLMLSNITSSQWTDLPTGAAFGFQSVSAIDDNNVWVAGSSVYRTTNGGANWINSTGSGIDPNASIYNVFAVDPLNAFVSGVKVGSPDVGLSYKTTNGGANWINVYSQQQGFINAVWMRNASEGIMIGDPVANFWSIYKTTNSGNNWFQSGIISAVTGESGAINSLYVLGDNIWFGANAFPWLYYSSNFGSSWVKQNITGVSGAYAIYFINSTTGMCGGPGNTHYTTNSGLNWIATPYPGTGAVNGVAGGGSFWLISKIGRSVYNTTNSGSNWVLEYQTPDSSQRTHMSKSRTGSRVWEVRNNGKVGRRDGPLGITTINSEVPVTNDLEQNFPNPFNPETFIRFKVKASSNVQLTIYDINGRIVSSLLNSFLNAGEYSISFNSSGLASGIYYYTLMTENFTDTKKMVVVK